MGGMRVGALCVAVVAGCFRPSPQAGAPCGPAGECPNGQTCTNGFCEPEGGNPPDGSALEPGARLVPSNGISPTLLDGATAEITYDKLDIDTDDGSMRSANLTVRAAGEGLQNGISFVKLDGMGVFSAKRFALGAGKSWNISGGNTVVFFSATTIDLNGTLDVGAIGGAGDLGGLDGGTTAENPACRGRAGGAYDLGFGDGGGGAGGATTGGDGAAASNGTPRPGGEICATPSTRPLRGGHGGGAGGVDVATGALRGGQGGGGGGAIALVAMGSISVGGIVASPGAGGLSLATGDGGGGGGGGGAVFLESPTIAITVSGAVTANGGGGAAPTGGASGARGHLTDANRAGGGAYLGVVGGLGGAANGAPGAGSTYTDGVSSRGAGGGGAGGAIEIRGVGVTIDAAAITSPTPMMTTAIVQ